MILVPILVVPQFLLSSTAFIFEALLFKSKYKKSDFNSCIMPLVEVFKDLENNGIEVKVEGKKITVYFVLALVLGDNLAVNGVLGFSESFSANFFCRIFKMPIADTKFASNAQESLLRNELNYTADLENLPFEECGIKFDTILNTLPNFHTTKNITVDIMHDLFEGVCHYNL